MAATAVTSYQHDPALVTARLREQLEERDEIIVALQHVIRDLRHEIDNLRAEAAYGAFVHTLPKRALLP